MRRDDGDPYTWIPYGFCDQNNLSDSHKLSAQIFNEAYKQLLGNAPGYKPANRNAPKDWSFDTLIKEWCEEEAQ